MKNTRFCLSFACFHLISLSFSCLSLCHIELEGLHVSYIIFISCISVVLAVRLRIVFVALVNLISSLSYIRSPLPSIDCSYNISLKPTYIHRYISDITIPLNHSFVSSYQTFTQSSSYINKLICVNHVSVTQYELNYQSFSYQSTH